MMNPETVGDAPLRDAPPLPPRSKDPIQMTIETLVRDELTENERNALAAFSAFAESVATGAHLDQWLSHIPALSRGRALCMRASHSNAPTGRRYAEMFGAWRDLYIKHLAAPEITALLWFADDAGRLIQLAELRATMTAGQRQRLTLPTSARKLVERQAKLQAEAAAGKERESPKEIIARLENENHRLKAELAKSDDGGLFDLRNDHLTDIASVIAGTISEQRWSALAKQVTATFRRKKQAHAG